MVLPVYRDEYLFMELKGTYHWFVGIFSVYSPSFFFLLPLSPLFYIRLQLLQSLFESLLVIKPFLSEFPVPFTFSCGRGVVIPERQEVCEV